MNKIKKFVAVVMCLSLGVIIFAACRSNKECITHDYSEWKIKKTPTCINEGQREHMCNLCGKIEVDILEKSNHNYANWVAEGTVGQSRTCQSCGYREFQYFQTGDKQPGENNPPSSLGVYSNFDMFMNDCKKASAYSLEYSGSCNEIEISLLDGVAKCDYYEIHIPSRVTDVKFAGSVKGTPFQNVKIIIDDRTTDINVDFENVYFESTETIFISESRNINVNISMEGQVCSFVVIGQGENGENGRDKSELDTGVREASPGQDGKNGYSAMFVNGNCNIRCSAVKVSVNGGSGGDGGRGGSVPNRPLVYGSGANGGNGGNGGNAITGERQATVTVDRMCLEATFNGGSGGLGGAGGSCHGIGVSSGSDGENGSNGVPGCIIVYQ